MKRKEVLLNLHKIMNENPLNGYSYILNDELKVGTGYCEAYNEKNRKIHIGIKELKGVLNKEIPDYILVYAIINIYHELRHYHQQEDFFNDINYKNSNNKQQIEEFFYSYLADMGCYYGYYCIKTNPENYFHNPREIDAEYSGIKETYSYLSKIYTEEKAKDLIINHINSKIGTLYYVEIKEPVKSIKEIDIIFKNAIRKSKLKKRMYNINFRDIDETIKYCQNINDEFILKINDINNGVLQDKVLAGAYMKYLNDFNLENNMNKSELYRNKYNSLIENTNKYLDEFKIKDEL